MILAKTSVIRDAWLKISADSALHQDVWLCDETILCAITSRYTTLPNAIRIDHKAINTALSKFAGAFDQTNSKGLYHAQSTMECPYKKSKRRMVHYYYRHVLKDPPAPPRSASDIEDVLAKSTRIIHIRERISAGEKDKNNNDNIGKAIEELKAETNQRNELNNAKKK